MPSNFPDGWAYLLDAGVGSQAQLTVPAGVGPVRNVMTVLNPMYRAVAGAGTTVYSISVYDGVVILAALLFRFIWTIDLAQAGEFSLDISQPIVGSAASPMIVQWDAAAGASFSQILRIAGYCI